MPQTPAKERTRSERSGISRMENEGGPAPAPQSRRDDLEARLAQYEIVSVPTTFFEWGGYRYSNAGDAIAAAKRGART
jgi:hypothetical protein